MPSGIGRDVAERYELQYVNGGLWMNFKDFTALTAALQSYGVEIEIDKEDSLNGRVVFCLKETGSNH